MIFAVLVALAAATPAKTRVYLDAGHGVGTNTGAQTVRCTDEADFTLALAKDVARQLEATGRFEVRVSRKTADGPSYANRLAAAKQFSADVLVSLHADTRGASEPHTVEEGKTCPSSREQPGFSILVSDEGGEKLAARRRRLGRAVADRMRSAGFEAYDGIDYGGLFVSDEAPGVFLDRRRLFMLRQPPMPSVIVETHHAWHVDEHAKWLDAATRSRFAKALAEALERGLKPAP